MFNYLVNTFLQSIKEIRDGLENKSNNIKYHPRK